MISVFASATRYPSFNSPVHLLITTMDHLTTSRYHRLQILRDSIWQLFGKQFYAWGEAKGITTFATNN